MKVRLQVTLGADGSMNFFVPNLGFKYNPGQMERNLI